MITVKMLKEILEKLPEDALVVSKPVFDNEYIADLGHISLENITFKDKDNVCLNKKIVNLNFFDISSKICDLLYLDSKYYHCSPSILLKNIEDNAKSLSYIQNLKDDNFLYKINENLVRESADSAFIIKNEEEDSNNIDKIFINKLLSKLKNSILEIQKLYRDINNDRNYKSFRNALRMLLYKE